MKKINNDASAYVYVYEETEHANREKEVLQVAKEAIIAKFSNEIWNKEQPYRAELIDDFWLVYGTLYVEIDGKRYADGEIGPDGKGVSALGGVVEVKISDEDLKVLTVYHSR